MNNFKTTALIGYTGFVGSNLYYDYKFTDVYNSKNINNIINKEYDCIICCGISGKKWYANLHPNEDLEQINSLINVLKQTKTNKMILISTIDIYDNINGRFDEDYMPDINYNNHAYGKNRMYMENFIIDNFSNHLIIRLPGLFGFGLKKNIIYDYLNHNLKEINNSSVFQWYNIPDLYDDINKILNSNIKIINLFTEPIQNSELHDIFIRYEHNLKLNLIDKNTIKYNILTKHTKSGYYYDKNYVLDKLNNYIKIMKCNNLIISNLSWKHNDDYNMSIKLQDYGINNLEIAPYKYFGKTCDIVDFSEINKHFDIYSFQAILYPLTYNLFKSENERYLMEKYLIYVIDLAFILGVKILVFGSPKNRKKENMSYNEAFEIAIPFFKKLGDYAHNKNMMICMEPNAKKYGCDFITNSIEGRELVLKVNSNGFKLHLDIGCMYMENENIIECIKDNLDIIKHIHFSAPELKNLCNFSEIDYNYLLKEIKRIYSGKVAIEMLNQDDYDVIKNIRYCLAY